MSGTRTSSRAKSKRGPSKTASRKRTRKPRSRAAKKPNFNPLLLLELVGDLVVRARPFVLLGGVFVTIYVALSLFTYDPGDPSFTYVNGQTVTNAGGPLGAWLSDLLFQFLGYGAWVVLPIGGLFGLRLAGRETAPVQRLAAWAALFWVVVCFVSLVLPLSPGEPFPAGGLLGEASTGAMQGIVGPAGTWLIVLGCAICLAPIVLGFELQSAAAQGLRGVEQAGPRLRAIGEQAYESLIGALGGAGERLRERLRRPALPDYGSVEDVAYESVIEDIDEDDDDVDSIPPSSVGSRITPTERAVAFFDEPSALFPPARPSVIEERTQVGQRELVEVEWETTSPRASAAPVSVGPSPEMVLPPARPSMPAPPMVVEPLSEDEIQEAVEIPDPSAPTPKRPSNKKKTPQKKGFRLEVDDDALVSGGESEDGLVVEVDRYANFELPHLGLLDTHERDVAQFDEVELQYLAETLEKKLADFGVKGEVAAIRPGPVITTFEYSPAPGIKISKISGLSDDIAMALKAMRVRIVAPIPGKGVVGIEIPNKKRQMIWIRDLLSGENFRKTRSALPMVLGKSVEGRGRITDLAKMPHLLIGGTTGSGKSVGINAMMLSLLYTKTPEELRLLLIDPKIIEFELYHDIPHLLHPVITDPKLAAAALKWACVEMDERYQTLARWKTRNIESFNRKLEKERKDWSPARARRYYGADLADDELPPPPPKMPYIVIVIDELADLMMIAAKEVEESIIRLAQKARAAGIHLIVATQRPSVNVITGLIKANMPSRVAFQIRTKVDSRTILDQNGAENLLGKGDMLFLPPGVAALERCHGAFVSDEEVRSVTDFLRSQGEPDYQADFSDPQEQLDMMQEEEEYDELYDLAVAYVCRQGKASTSMIQREFKIGYNRAARMIEVMEREGVVGPADGARPRAILAPTH
ncbi:MAG: DNA translocase FtsK [Myxococcota bacterium]